MLDGSTSWTSVANLKTGFWPWISLSSWKWLNWNLLNCQAYFSGIHILHSASPSNSHQYSDSFGVTVGRVGLEALLTFWHRRYVCQMKLSWFWEEPSSDFHLWLAAWYLASKEWLNCFHWLRQAGGLCWLLGHCLVLRTLEPRSSQESVLWLRSTLADHLMSRFQQLYISDWSGGRCCRGSPCCTKWASLGWWLSSRPWTGLAWARQRLM